MRIYYYGKLISVYGQTKSKTHDAIQSNFTTVGDVLKQRQDYRRYIQATDAIKRPFEIRSFQDA